MEHGWDRFAPFYDGNSVRLGNKGTHCQRPPRHCHPRRMAWMLMRATHCLLSALRQTDGPCHLSYTSLRWIWSVPSHTSAIRSVDTLDWWWEHLQHSRQLLTYPGSLSIPACWLGMWYTAEHLRVLSYCITIFHLISYCVDRFAEMLYPAVTIFWWW